MVLTRCCWSPCSVVRVQKVLRLKRSLTPCGHIHGFLDTMRTGALLTRLPDLFHFFESTQPPFPDSRVPIRLIFTKPAAGTTEGNRVVRAIEMQLRSSVPTRNSIEYQKHARLGVGSQNSVTFCNQQLAILGFRRNRPWRMRLRVLQTRVHAPIHPRSPGRCPSFLPQPE